MVAAMKASNNELPQGMRRYDDPECLDRPQVQAVTKVLMGFKVPDSEFVQTGLD
jgi:hypothetical protein